MIPIWPIIILLIVVFMVVGVIVLMKSAQALERIASAAEQMANDIRARKNVSDGS